MVEEEDEEDVFVDEVDETRQSKNPCSICCLSMLRPITTIRFKPCVISPSEFLKNVDDLISNTSNTACNT